MFDEKGRYIIENYQKKPVFSSFLPGISGLTGIPVWSFYVNRGQGIASFGVQDKDHAIMEFYPAHEAYQNTKNKGFRTFLKVNGVYYEPFHSLDGEADMYIGLNELELEEENKALGIRVRALYYTLPNEKLGGIVRRISVENLGEKPLAIEMLDGLPAVIPYGIGMADMKEMCQTMTAWMQVEDVKERRPYYRVRYSTKDSAKVEKIKEGNFILAFSGEGELLPVLADANVVFGYDTSMEIPVGFLQEPVSVLAEKKQNLSHQVPAGFSCRSVILPEKGRYVSYMIAGSASGKGILKEFAEKRQDRSYFSQKEKEAAELAVHMTEAAAVKTGNPVFDAYCRQTYLDNLLRGGYPVKLGKKDVFYVYSRKHGDLERDYNYFSISPEYYSQGNGNYRDVNQNRRCDVLFAPWVGDYNIKLFFDLIQTDGCNPLVIRPVTYHVKNREAILEGVCPPSRDMVKHFLERSFSPGELFQFLEENHVGLTCDKKDFLDLIADNGIQEFHADFSEGYWTDHWTYNLDLIETYLEIFPDREEELIFLDKGYTFYKSQAVVLPRKERYMVSKDGVRQNAFLKEVCRHSGQREKLRTKTGEVFKTTLAVKLFTVAVNKFATLDTQGLGIEMEAGKPGWYDALNGMPGIFGSSMCESYELFRLIRFLLKEIKCYKRPVVMPEELDGFMKDITQALFCYYEEGCSKEWLWDEMNLAKEAYRKKTEGEISGREIERDGDGLAVFLETCGRYLAEGIFPETGNDRGIPLSYFYYHFTDLRMEEGKMYLENGKRFSMPLFLEGAVHYMKLLAGKEERRGLYTRIKESPLYDKELSMYKVNASLKDVPFEAGRAKAFSPGWLENESVWLHMEYKYLLELLKGELYEEFFEDFYKAGIPFMEEDVYGRSPLENVSFLVSSANENRSLWGRGFVARLSGATAEFLQMWHIMMFGKAPFFMMEGKLACGLRPAIPQYLMPEDRKLACTFLGRVRVVYDFGNVKKVIPGSYQWRKIHVLYADGTCVEEKGSVLLGNAALAVREGLVKELDLYA